MVEATMTAMRDDKRGMLNSSGWSLGRRKAGRPNQYWVAALRTLPANPAAGGPAGAPRGGSLLRTQHKPEVPPFPTRATLPSDAVRPASRPSTPPKPVGSPVWAAEATGTAVFGCVVISLYLLGCASPPPNGPVPVAGPPPGAPAPRRCLDPCRTPIALQPTITARPPRTVAPPASRPALGGTATFRLPPSLSAGRICRTHRLG